MANNPEQPHFAEVLIKSEPELTEQDQDATVSFSFKTVVKEELIIDEIDDDEVDDKAEESGEITHRKDGTIDCDECGKNLPDYKTYQQHCRRHRNIRQRRWVCKPCDRVFGENSELTKHNKCLHSKREKTKRQLVQEEDDAINPDKIQLDGNGLFKCPECDKRFKSWSLVITHTQGHGNLRKRMFKCKHCGRFFESKKALVLHERAHDATTPVPFPEVVMRNDSTVFKCADCGKVFPTMKGYHKHARRHEILKQGAFQCQICKVILAFQSELDRHMEKHENKTEAGTSEKNEAKVGHSYLTCGTCGKLHKTEVELRKHVKRHQALEKGLYKCNICGTYFSANCSLKLHRRKFHPNQTFEDDIKTKVEGHSSDKVN